MFSTESYGPMTMSTVFITARHSLEDLPRIQRVHPLLRLPRISCHAERGVREVHLRRQRKLTQAAMSNATFRSCDTLRPGRISMFPGARQTTWEEIRRSSAAVVGGAYDW